MSSFWADFLVDSQCAANCKLITRNGKFKETHKILLAATSDFLKCLLLDISQVDEAVIFLPDYQLNDLEEYFSSILDQKVDPSKSDLAELLELKTSPFLKLDEYNVQLKNEYDTEKNVIKTADESLIKIEEHAVDFDEQDSSNAPDPSYESPDEDVYDAVSSDDSCRSFKCQKCPKSFTALRRLKHHTATIHEKIKTDFSRHYNRLDSGLFECKLCKKSVEQLSQFKKHMKRTHALGAKYKCDICERPFCYTDDLEKHKLHCEEDLASAETKKFECTKCGKRLSKPRIRHKCVKIIVGDKDVIFTTNGAVPNIDNGDGNSFIKLDSTITEVSVDKIIVKEETPEQLNQNVVILPKEIDHSKYVECEHCDHKCKNKTMMKAHITIRHPELSEQMKYVLQVDGGFQCTICMKVFKRRSKCNYHVKMFHKIGAKLECRVCKKPFYYEYEMNHHMKIHSDTKEAYCDLCGKGFSQKYVLKAHMISAHSSKQEKESARSFFCSFCAKGFFSNAAMKEHELLHGETKNFHCTQCPKSFKQSSGLRSHVKRWHGDRDTPFLNEAQKARMAAYMVKYRAEKKAKKLGLLNQP